MVFVNICISVRGETLEWIQGNRDHMSHFVDRMWEIIQANPKRGSFDNVNCPPCFFGGSVVFFAFNLEKYPFNDARVRRALYYVLLANNMENIRKAAEAAFSGYLLTVGYVYPVPLIPGLGRTEKYVAKDLVEAFLKDATIDNAKKLLDEAGVIDRDGNGIRELPDGKPFKFTIIVPAGWVPVIGSATAFADIWRTTLGVDAIVQPIDFSVVWQKVSTGDYEATWWLHSTRMSASSPWLNIDVAMDSRLPTNPWSGPISRYNNPVANWLLDEVGRAWDESRRAYIYRLLQEIWLRDLPFLILGQDPHWYQYSEDYWWGCPNKERIEKYGMFYATNWDPAFIFVLMQIKPAKDVKPGDVPPVPDAIKPQNRIPAAKFFEELEKVAAAPVAPPATVTTTVTAAAQTVTVTTVSTSTATTAVEVTNWAITVALAIVLLVVGFAIGWFLKKK